MNRNALRNARKTVAKVESAFREEIAKTLKDGLTRQENAAAKKGFVNFK